MDAQYTEGDIISITAEDGTPIELEYILTVEYNGSLYVACLPISIDGKSIPEDSEDYGMVILRIEDGEGDQYLALPDTEEEAQSVYEIVDEMLYGDGDEEDTEENEDGED